ncbi:hypothetical protein SGRA_0161 [Saprospira grandis str. Lewin]|uniref:Uncharacterized protein n=2 Tax=Saprospira grandis (strain Lewin) TaxID=984262 RepID=H6L533_SAPGL|nr:hypothetical protein SGRA_0161 [Saprospira grandis str. Lewin]
MVGSAAKPQTQQKLVFCAGPSEQRAAERSADERSEAEAPKKRRKSQASSPLSPAYCAGGLGGVS